MSATPRCPVCDAARRPGIRRPSKFCGERCRKAAHKRKKRLVKRLLHWQSSDKKPVPLESVAAIRVEGTR